jgi:hypothetical protein
MPVRSYSGFLFHCYSRTYEKRRREFAGQEKLLIISLCVNAQS